MIWVLRRIFFLPGPNIRPGGAVLYNRGATRAWVAKLVDARDLRKLSTRLGNGRREWGQSRWNSSTQGWLQYRAKPWSMSCSRVHLRGLMPGQGKCRDLTAPA